MRDPVAQAGAGSEEIWYQYGGARLAYTAVARPKQLYTGYGAVRDPALSGPAPATSQESSPKKRYRPKAKTAKPVTTAAPAKTATAGNPDCPPCPPADTVKNTPQKPNPGSASYPPASGAAGAVARPSSPLQAMPAATPLSISPNAPGP